MEKEIFKRGFKNSKCIILALIPFKKEFCVKVLLVYQYLAAALLLTRCSVLEEVGKNGKIA